jgi:hypothetical protein
MSYHLLSKRTVVVGGAHPQITGTRKVLAILVKAHRHDPVSGVKRLFNSITVMNIDVNVQYTGVIAVEYVNQTFTIL